MNKKPNNPFILSGFIGKKYFCDRESELDWMKDNWVNDRNMAIYAWRRMGKTALIRCFYHELEQQKESETIYIDLMATNNIQSAIRAITFAVHNRYGKTSSGISAAIGKLFSNLGATITFDPNSGKANISFGWKPTGIPERSFESIGEFLVKRRKKVTIALDEFQQVKSYSESTAESIFRSWMQSFPQLRFVFSGSHRKMMQSMFSESNRPFYRSVQQLELKPIHLESYRSFIQSHFEDAGKKISDSEVSDICKWSRGQTYSIQLVCNKLYGTCTNVQPEDLQRVFYEIIEQEKPVFANYYKLLTERQWSVLKAIAMEEPASNPMSKEFIANHHLGAGSTVNTALKALQSKEMVIQQDGDYYVHDVLLSHWLRSL